MLGADLHPKQQGDASLGARHEWHCRFACLAISLCLLCAFAVRRRNPGSNQDRQKRVSRQGTKLAKAGPKRGKVCGIIGAQIGARHRVRRQAGY